MPVDHTNGPAKQGRSGPPPPDEVIFGQTEAMSAVRKRVQKIAGANIPLLIEGEGGTGKEVLARWVHRNSGFSSGEFVKVNCAAIPSTLLESELFGYEKGAFTGAIAAKPGRVELAHNGTLFLDEISDLDISLQSKVLHFIQDGSFSRIGDTTERSVTTRLICACNRDLRGEIQGGRFREDLFYRINVVQLRLPRLRDRREDIPGLAEYFRMLCNREFGKESQPFTADILKYLQSLEWPGNVRELANGVARYVLLGPEGAIVPPAAPPKRFAGSYGIVDETVSVPLKRIAKDAIREMERNVIVEALRANQWNRRKAAQALQISYRALIYKIRNAGLGQRNGISEPMNKR